MSITGKEREELRFVSLTTFLFFFIDRHFYTDVLHLLLFQPNLILANLHTALHEDAVLHMYEKTLREVPLFENADKSFFRIFGKNVREKYYRRGHVIVKAYDVVRFVFIIYRGKVVFLI